MNYLNQSTNQNDGLAGQSRPTSEAREKPPGDEVGKIPAMALPWLPYREEKNI